MAKYNPDNFIVSRERNKAKQKQINIPKNIEEIMLKSK
tara:strand:- start:9 stop:122 length:114 start_codon:yes stop_codon:yes gene_type:complete